MKRPTSQQVMKVIRNFQKIPFWCRTRFSLDMWKGNVSRFALCGTPHCHGGWYASVIYQKYIRNHHIYYGDGARIMAQHLGFTNQSEMTMWFRMNEDIWGNSDAREMFSGEMAFYHPTKRPKGARHLDHIIDHWKEVYERIVALENKELEAEQKKKVEYPDITKSLAILPTEEKPDVKVKQITQKV